MVVPCHPIGSAAAEVIVFMEALDGDVAPSGQGQGALRAFPASLDAVRKAKLAEEGIAHDSPVKGRGPDGPDGEHQH